MTVKFEKLKKTIIKCKKCPRLFNFIKKISLEKGSILQPVGQPTEFLQWIL